MTKAVITFTKRTEAYDRATSTGGNAVRASETAQAAYRNGRSQYPPQFRARSALADVRRASSFSGRRRRSSDFESAILFP